VLVGIDDAVTLPVADTTLGVDDCWSVVDRYPVRYLGLVGMATFVPGAPLLAKSQILVQFLSHCVGAGIYPPVDGFSTDNERKAFAR
jgi:hypothetical protein